MSHKVFISHSSRDTWVAKRIAEAIEKCGAGTFLDQVDVQRGDDFEEKVIGVLNVKSGWEKTLAGFGVNTILLPPGTPLSGALKESSRWRVVYDDGIALVFRSTSRTVGIPLSAASKRGGEGRDREVTKTLASDPAITETKPKT